MKKLFTFITMLVPLSIFASDFITNFEWLEPNNKVEVAIGESYQLKFSCSDNSLPFKSDYVDSWVHYDFAGGQHVVTSPTGYSIDNKGVIKGLVAGSYAIKFTGMIQAKSGVDKWLYITVVSEKSEKESNNTLDTANDINTKIRFGLFNVSDIDYFRYTNNDLKFGDIVEFKIHYNGSRDNPFGYKWATFCGENMVGGGSLISQDQMCKATVASSNTVYLEVYYDQSSSQYFNYGEEFVAEVYINGKSVITTDDDDNPNENPNIILSGSCGTNVSFTLDTSGVLSITGTGAMTDYSSYSSVPWYSNRSYIKTVDIADDIISIGKWTFYGCSSLISITIPNSVTSIGYGAFRYCSGLTSVTIGNSVTSIGDLAFSNCYGLTSVTISNSVTSIGNYAFSGCSSLTSATIPNSITTIGDYTFNGCSSLTSITIPNSVTSIGEHTFSSCSGLTSITIPNSVTSIGEYAFHYCSGLTSVTIGNSVTKIGRSAFGNCPELSDVYCYAEKVPTTYSNAFADSNIKYTTLHVPENSFYAYKTAEPWSGFGTIKTISGDIPEMPKCATPTITIVNGKIKFASETEGVSYVYDITPSTSLSGNGDEAPLLTKYTISVYATKEGFENSDVATKEIEVGSASGIKGDVNEDGTVNGTDIQEVINIIVNAE